MIDTKALFNISYGLFVLVAREGDKDNGCIVNTVTQVAEEPLTVGISVNKKNLTHDMILRTGLLNICILTEETPFKVFQHFGFQSGRNVNKFQDCAEEYRSENGLLYLPKYTNAFISGQVSHAIDMGGHTLFLAAVKEAQILGDKPSVSYTYYQKNIKQVPPAKKGWRCKICGYVYEGDELPKDFICPLCKHGIEAFEKI
jgi:flavin reductase (DIM6/NTAB) family NADH-FMN oxidoreductase RutF